MTTAATTLFSHRFKVSLQKLNYMGTIALNNIRIYAYHGCLGEEGVIGSEYRVDVELSADLNKAAHSDTLSDTVDYVTINRLIKEEMKKRSKLLENVSKRIVDRIFSEHKMVTDVLLKISKINPPITGDVEMVTVTLKEKRS